MTSNELIWKVRHSWECWRKPYFNVPMRLQFDESRCMMWWRIVCSSQDPTRKFLKGRSGSDGEFPLKIVIAPHEMTILDTSVGNFVILGRNFLISIVTHKHDWMKVYLKCKRTGPHFPKDASWINQRRALVTQAKPSARLSILRLWSYQRCIGHKVSFSWRNTSIFRRPWKNEKKIWTD